MKYLFFSCILLILSCKQQKDVLITNFEKGDYSNWDVFGGAFGNRPASKISEYKDQDFIEGIEGNNYVNSSLHKGDSATGKLVSPLFTISRKYLNLLIGGGGFTGKTCVNVIVDDTVISSVTGSDINNLREEAIDLSEFKGKKGKVEIVDESATRNGRIYVDNLVLSNIPSIEDRELKFTVDKKYLVFPIKENGKWRRVQINLDGQPHEYAEISISDSAIPGYYAFINMEKHLGKDLTIYLNKLTNDQFSSLENIKLVDEVPGFDSLYKELLRPRFHFTTRRGWQSDPNGSIYYDGMYHMYYQQNPFGWYFGYNIGWGHATSEDLIHWTEHDGVLRPVHYNDHAWSGSAVIDFNNTAGFQEGDKPPIVAFYTSTQRGECIAYSNDGGMTFEQFEGNPILTGVVANRDPSVLWYEPAKHWVMTRHLVGEYIGFYTSNDLKNWDLQSKIGEFHSFPEIFELPVEGKNGIRKWVIHDMNGMYKVGDFNGKIFTSDFEDEIPYNQGSSFFSMQTINNHPDNKRIAFASTYNGVAPGMPFNNCMLFPVELRLKETSKGIRLCPKPIDAISMLHDKKIVAENKNIGEINQMLEAEENLGDLLHLKMKTSNLKSNLTLQVNGVTITIDVDQDSLYCKGNLIPPVKPIWRTAIDENGAVKGPMDTGGEIELEVLLDKITLEIFANNGEMYMPIGLYFHEDFRAGLWGTPIKKAGTIPFMDVSQRGIKLICNDENVFMSSFEVYTMKSIWK